METRIDMPHYELLFIISNKFTDDEQGPLAEKTMKLVEEAGGKMTYSEAWGKKKLAYPIRGLGYGYYHLVEFDAEGEAVARIDRGLRLSEDILRHMIVARAYRSPEQIEKEKEEYRKRREKQAIEKAAPAEPKSELKPKPKEKVNLEELDKKLDNILDTGDLL